MIGLCRYGIMCQKMRLFRNKQNEMQFTRDVDQHMVELSQVEILAFLIEFDIERQSK